MLIIIFITLSLRVDETAPYSSGEKWKEGIYFILEVIIVGWLKAEIQYKNSGARIESIE